jgi:transcriptional regulator with XRE-family HTH domain
MTINERIKDFRKKIGINQSLFASKIGVKQATLSQIENGVIKPSLDLLQKIVTQFDGTSYSWLIDGKESINSDNSTSKIENEDQNTSLEITATLERIIDRQEKEIEHLHEMIDHLKEELNHYRSNNQKAG